MQIQAIDLRVGDIIQEKGWRGGVSRTTVQLVRHGGHIGNAGLSSTPLRLIRYASVIVNEQFSYPPTAWLTVLRDGGKIEEVAGGRK